MDLLKIILAIIGASLIKIVVSSFGGPTLVKGVDQKWDRPKQRSDAPFKGFHPLVASLFIVQYSPGPLDVYELIKEATGAKPFLSNQGGLHLRVV